MFKIIKNLFKKPKNDNLKILISTAHFYNARKDYKEFKKLHQSEFKVFSQNGEDGILDYLFFQLGISTPKFVEIGVGDYSECNTRYLFETRNIKGLIIDCN